MEFLDSHCLLNDVLQVDRIHSWEIYGRLKQLAIPCELASGQPLQVQIDTAAAVVQIWSVAQQFTASRQDKLERLERCWQTRFNSRCLSE